MSRYNALQQYMQSVVRTNGEQSITGAAMQAVLNSFIGTLRAGSLFKGVATPMTVPNNDDANTFYLAGQDGVYANFGAVSLDGEIAVLSNATGQWVKETVALLRQPEFDFDGAGAFDVAEDGSAELDMTGETDFIGSVAGADEPPYVELSVTGNSAGSVYRVTFDSDVAGLAVGNGTGTTYVEVPGPIRRGDVVFLTDISDTTGGWSASVTSAAVISGDGSLEVGYLPNGTVDIRWNPVEVNLGGKVSVRRDFSVSPGSYSAANVGKYRKLLSFPYGKRAMFGVSRDSSPAEQNLLFAVSGRNGGSVLYRMYGDRFGLVDDRQSGRTFLVAKCPSSQYEYTSNPYDIQVLQYSGVWQDDVEEETGVATADELSESHTVYNEPMSSLAHGFSMSSPAVDLDLDLYVDFVGSMPSAMADVVVTVDNEALGKVYRMTFSKDITSSLTVKGGSSGSVTYCTVPGPIRAGSTVTFTAASYQSGGWLYETSAPLVSSDGSLNVTYSDGVLTLGLPDGVLFNHSTIQETYDDKTLAIGHNSQCGYSGNVAVGNSAKANGDQSVSVGTSSEATGTRSCAYGFFAKANGSESFSSGYSSEATGNGSTANGNYSTASGNNSTAVGYSATASGYSATAIAIGATASGHNSTALGYQSNCNGSSSVAVGTGASAAGLEGTAVGALSRAESTCGSAYGSAAVAGLRGTASGNGAAASEYFTDEVSKKYADARKFDVLRSSVSGNEGFFHSVPFGTSTVHITYNGTQYEVSWDGSSQCVFLVSSQYAGDIVTLLPYMELDSIQYKNNFAGAYVNYRNGIKHVKSISLGDNLYAVTNITRTWPAQAPGEEDVTSCRVMALVKSATQSGEGVAVGYTAMATSGAVAVGPGCMAVSQGQVALGRYNAVDQSHRVVIGSGSGDADRGNGLVVDSSWNLRADGVAYMRSFVPTGVADRSYSEAETVNATPNVREPIVRVDYTGPSGYPSFIYSVSADTRAEEGQRLTVYCKGGAIGVRAYYSGLIEIREVGSGNYVNLMFLDGKWRFETAPSGN